MTFYGTEYDNPPTPDPYPPDLSALDGSRLLEAVEEFLRRFVAYPGDAERVAHVLWIAHTWFMDAWDSTPRLAFLSPEPGSGKSRALEVSEPLVPRPVHAVNVSPAYLFRKVSDPEGRPTVLYDEIDTVFGPKAKDNEDIRGLLNAGHRQGATAGRAVIRGKQVFTEELPAYCAVALAGLDDLPDTLMTRAVVVRMRRRSPTEHVEPWRRRLNAPEAHRLRDELEAWSLVTAGHITWPDMPAGVEDRDADVWEALIAVADLAAGLWPERARAAAVALVGKSRDRSGSLGVALLRDLRTVFGELERMPTEAILDALHELEESPWGDLRGKPLDARGLSRRIGKYGVKPRLLRDGERVFRGYDALDLTDPWSRYLTDPADRNAVTDVTDARPRAGADVAPGSPPSWESPIYNTQTGTEAPHPLPRGGVTSVTRERCPLHPEHPKPGACDTCERIAS